MNVGIFLGHPAHFHYFKNMARQLKANGHNVFFAVKEKDILETLMKDAGFEYDKVRGKREKSDKWHLATSVLELDWNLGRFVRSHKIDIIVGAIFPLWSRVNGVHAIVIGEDDARVVPLYSWLALPLSSNVVSPMVCDNWIWEHKSIKYPANLELAYLHPNHFTADAKVVKGYGIDVDKPYFVMRFASLHAHHDNGIKGINTEIAERLVKILEPHGTIYITSERPLEPQFEKYRIKINPLDMHHVMTFANLYIGDSQTMAAEAGVLGVPFVRFNDFVGRIGYLRELEDKYELGYGIHARVLPDDSPIRKSGGAVQPSGTEALYNAVEQLVAMDAAERRALYQQRRQRMLAEKIDCAKFLTYFIENYPQSVAETKNANDEFWKRFK